MQTPGEAGVLRFREDLRCGLIAFNELHRVWEYRLHYFALGTGLHFGMCRGMNSGNWGMGHLSRVAPPEELRKSNENNHNGEESVF